MNARAQQDNQTKLAINAADNQTAKDIAAAEIAAGERAKFSTGSSMKPE